MAALCLAMICAVISNVIFVWLPREAAAVFVVILLGISCGIPIFLVRDTLNSSSQDAENTDKIRLSELVEMSLGVEQPNEEQSLKQLVKPVLIQSILPVAMFLLYAASQLVTLSFEGHHEFVTWSILAAPLCALLPCALHDDSRRVTFALRILLPFLGIATLGAAVIAPDSLEASIAALGTQMLCYMYGLVMLALVVYFACARKRSALVFLGALAVVILAIVMVLPHLTPGVLQSEVSLSIVIVILIVALCLLASSPSLALWTGTFTVAQAAQSAGNMDDSDGHPNSAAQTLSQNVQRACDAAADAYALSPREREILQYLGRGYGPRYLATILPIKENTIRSHVRNIYSKTDVHTQAELLELIDSFADKGSDS